MKPKFKSLIYTPTTEREKTETENGSKEIENDNFGIRGLVERENTQKDEKNIIVKLIPREKLQFSVDNDYEQTNIESLADSILNVGLQNFPSGYYVEDEDRYILQNGERRTRAIDFLLEKYKHFDDIKDENELSASEKNLYRLYCKNVQRYRKGYPIYVNSVLNEIGSADAENEIDVINRRLTLIDCNTEVRINPDERLRHITEKKALLERKKQLLGGNESININREIARSEGISERQVQKYNAVATLIPELQDLFKRKEITLNDGEFYAGLSPDDQMRIVHLISAGEQGTAKEIQQLNELLHQVEEEKQKNREEYEKKICMLQEEKESQEQAVATLVEATKRQAEEEKQQIRTAIEEEYRKRMPDPEQISTLQTRLTDAESKYKSTLDVLNKEKNKAEEKDRQIKKLKEELEKLKSKENSVLEDRERFKAELQYQKLKDDVTKNINELLKLVKYIPANEVELFVGELQKVLQKFIC